MNYSAACSIHRNDRDNPNESVRDNLIGVSWVTNSTGSKSYNLSTVKNDKTIHTTDIHYQAEDKKIKVFIYIRI